MALYKVEICGVNTAKLPLLKNKEKEELFEKILQGDKEARETYIKGNLRLVLSIIQRFNNNNENVDDLFQIGCIGLMKAVDNFDVTQGVKFSTYAVPMIIGEIRRYEGRGRGKIRDVAFQQAAGGGEGEVIQMEGVQIVFVFSGGGGKGGDFGFLHGDREGKFQRFDFFQPGRAGQRSHVHKAFIGQDGQPIGNDIVFPGSVFRLGNGDIICQRLKHIHPDGEGGCIKGLQGIAGNGMEQCVFRNFPFPFFHGIGSGDEGNEEGIFRWQGSAVHLTAKGLAGVIVVGQLGRAIDQGHIVQPGMVDGIDQRLSGGVLQGEADG